MLNKKTITAALISVTFCSCSSIPHKKHSGATQVAPGISGEVNSSLPSKEDLAKKAKETALLKREKMVADKIAKTRARVKALTLIGLSGVSSANKKATLEVINQSDAEWLTVQEIPEFQENLLSLKNHWGPEFEKILFRARVRASVSCATMLSASQDNQDFSLPKEELNGIILTRPKSSTISIDLSQ